VSSLQIILVATADSSEGMQQSIRRCFRHEIGMKTMNEEQRNKLISETIQGIATVTAEVHNCSFSAQKLFLQSYTASLAYAVSLFRLLMSSM
jgi:AAA+ superfamily predicted ATPase